MMMTRRIKSSRGFTMVEIAFSLAIVAFALVAIMGVLPTGMTVQKDNREDTLINNDGTFWTEALRSGSRAIYDLTNYVEEISISNSKGTKKWVARWANSTVPDKLDTPEQIVGLLSTPKYELVRGVVMTNSVIARVRAINGPAVDKTKPTNEFVFRYQLESEVTPVYPAPVDTKNSKDAYQYWIGDNGNPAVPYHLNVATNLHNLRLTMRWPVFEQGNTWGVGRNRKTIRALVNGQTEPTVSDFTEGHTNFNVAHPNTYQYVSIQPEP
ncbi:MAG TPA: type II secretion system protein [Verrucomicrobiae bacterium]|jgi:type II secretory pathway pseudopilin PulG